MMDMLISEAIRLYSIPVTAFLAGKTPNTGDHDMARSGSWVELSYPPAERSITDIFPVGDATWSWYRREASLYTRIKILSNAGRFLPRATQWSLRLQQLRFHDLAHCVHRQSVQEFNPGGDLVAGKFAAAIADNVLRRKTPAAYHKRDDNLAELG